jgi:hypothetical protein
VKRGDHFTFGSDFIESMKKGTMNPSGKQSKPATKNTITPV